MPERKRTGRTVALVGGAALAVWVLSRGKGWAFGAPGDGSGARVGGTRLPAACKVLITPEGIEVDGIKTDLPNAIAKCRGVGTAEVRATGDAITRNVHQVINELRRAGVTMYTPIDLTHLVPTEPL